MIRHNEDVWWFRDIRRSERGEWKWEVLITNEPPVGSFVYLGPFDEVIKLFYTLPEAVAWCGQNVQNPWQAVAWLAGVVEASLAVDNPVPR